MAVGKVQDALPTPDLSSLNIVESQTHAVGLIHPPPDIRAIVDKTAQFVAKNGEACLDGHNVLSQQNPLGPHHSVQLSKMLHVFTTVMCVVKCAMPTHDCPPTLITHRP